MWLNEGNIYKKKTLILVYVVMITTILVLMSFLANFLHFQPTIYTLHNFLFTFFKPTVHTHEVRTHILTHIFVNHLYVKCLICKKKNVWQTNSFYKTRDYAQNQKVMGVIKADFFSLFIVLCSTNKVGINWNTRFFQGKNILEFGFIVNILYRKKIIMRTRNFARNVVDLRPFFTSEMSGKKCVNQSLTK